MWLGSPYMVTNDYTGIYAYVRIPNLLEYSAITRTTFDHSMVWSLYVHYSDNHIFTAGLILHTDHRLAHTPCTCQIARCFTLTACMGLLFWSSISSSHSDLVIFRVGFLFLLPPADGFTIPISHTVPCGDTSIFFYIRQIEYNNTVSLTTKVKSRRQYCRYLRDSLAPVPCTTAWIHWKNLQAAATLRGDADVLPIYHQQLKCLSLLNIYLWSCRQ